jgi:tetratricopeptide (TPR) repeat protein
MLYQHSSRPAMTIEHLIEKERWGDARAMLRAALKKEPEHHWLLTRLSLTYYEQRRYAKALKYAERAFASGPACPLVLWDYAGALQMVGRHSEALELYARIVTRDISDLASAECGEGRAWARGLVADAHYRASLSLRALGNEDASVSAFEQCLDQRGPGCRSIYRLDELGGRGVHERRPNKRLQPTKTRRASRPVRRASIRLRG